MDKSLKVWFCRPRVHGRQGGGGGSPAAGVSGCRDPGAGVDRSRDPPHEDPNPKPGPTPFSQVPPMPWSIAAASAPLQKRE